MTSFVMDVRRMENTYESTTRHLDTMLINSTEKLTFWVGG